MRNLRWMAALAAVLALGAGTSCGTAATGISLAIDPDPVQGVRQADGSYVADWDAVVADLTGVGGTVESVDATFSGASLIPDARTHQSVQLQPTSMAVDAFARRLFHQNAHFTVTNGSAASITVSVQFKDENGQAYSSSAQARLNLR